MKYHKYFGTDGIRGIFGKFPINYTTIVKLGIILGKIFVKKKYRNIIIGQDTRISGNIIIHALSRGLNIAKLNPILLGIIPTPTIAYLSRTSKYNLGIIVSASHNPYYYNGFKIFIRGFKINIKLEKIIENKINNFILDFQSFNYINNNFYIFCNATKTYIQYCKKYLPPSLNGLKIIIDCSNGSTSHIVPEIFKKLNHSIIFLGIHPNGININKQCGSTNLTILKKKILQLKADIGIAYDGDGDRLIMIDHLGNTVNGDHIIYIIAKYYLQKYNIRNGVIGTKISNLGLELALKNINIPFIRTEIGDRFISNMLKIKKWKFGAETSGHIILLDKNTTGDAILASIEILNIVIDTNKNLNSLCSNINLFPQKIINIPIEDHNNFFTQKKTIIFFKKLKNDLKKNEKIYLRKSGTEPIMRIIIEGQNKKRIDNIIQYIKKYYQINMIN